MIALFALVWSASAFAAAEPLSFDSALQQILARSPAITAADAQARFTQARDLPLRWGWTPTVSLAGTRSEGTTSIADETLTASTLKGELSASLNLFRFGADWEGIQKASADDRKSQADLENAYLKTEDTAVQALIAWLEAQERVRVLGSFVELQTRSQGIAEQRYAKGLLARQEVDKATLDLQNMRARLTDQQAQQADAAATLMNLLGEDSIRAEWPWSRQLLDAQFVPQILGSGGSIESRPDLHSALAQLESDDRLLARTRRLLLPTLDASYGGGLYHPYDGTNNYSASSWSLVLTIPLWSQLQDFANVRAQNARREGSEADLLRVRRESTADLSAAGARLRVLVDSNREQQKSLAIAQRLLDDGLARFKQGRESTNDLSVDQTRLLDTELLLVQSWANTHLAFSRYCHAVGKRVPACLQAR